MSKVRFFSLALAAALMAGSVAAETSWAMPGRARRIYSYRPADNALAQGRVQTNRRYSYSPGASGSANSTPSNGETLGLRRTYQPGSGYAPRQAINSATWKVQGL
jgi:hypothetical protein